MADITISDIDEQIRKLQELKRFMSDPSMANLVNQLRASKEAANPVSGRNTQREYKAKGGFAEEILATCKSIGIDHEFTISDVIAAHEARGCTFTAKDKMVATYSALKRLVARREVALVKRGIGSNPSVYVVPS